MPPPPIPPAKCSKGSPPKNILVAVCGCCGCLSLCLCIDRTLGWNEDRDGGDGGVAHDAMAYIAEGAGAAGRDSTVTSEGYGALMLPHSPQSTLDLDPYSAPCLVLDVPGASTEAAACSLPSFLFALLVLARLAPAALAAAEGPEKAPVDWETR